MQYYVWAQYYFAPAAKQVKSKEVKFYDGHHHGVQPTQNDKDEVITDLVAKVSALAADRGLVEPDDVAAQAEIRTRKAH